MFAVTTPLEAQILENLFEELSKVSFGQRANDWKAESDFMQVRLG